MRKFMHIPSPPPYIGFKSESQQIRTLVDEIKAVCLTNPNSYMDINRALYIADTEIHQSILNSKFTSKSKESDDEKLK